MEWQAVKWSEAGQILALLKAKETPEAARKSPEVYCAELVRDGRLDEAVKFLALALPRLEAVAWAARTVRDIDTGHGADTPEGDALKGVLLWLQDPIESRRRNAYDAAQACDPASAEAMAAMAAFYSGGSIAPPDCEPLPAPHDTAGRFAAVAILIAAAQCEDSDAVLAKALGDGARLAKEGLKSPA
jgi:hypothetical protein